MLSEKKEAVGVMENKLKRLEVSVEHKRDVSTGCALYTTRHDTMSSFQSTLVQNGCYLSQVYVYVCDAAGDIW